MNNRPNPKEPSLARQYPTLEGLKIPDALKTAIRRAYQHIYDLRDDMLQRFAAAGDGGCCTLFKGTVPTEGDLPATGNEIGDGWIVEDTGHLWFWDGTAWVDAGSVTGPPGPAGPAGPPGPPGSGGSGTVTSVALTVPAEFSIAGSPVTTSGTLAVSKATQSANTVYAGPTTGSAAAPTFRAVVPADLPLASSSAFGAVKVDGTTITAASGVISAAGGSSGALILLEQHTASSSATLDFTAWYSSSYDEYVIEMISLIPATSNQNLILRCSTNGGSSYDSGSNYQWMILIVYTGSTGANVTVGSNSDTSIIVGSNPPNSSLYGTSGSYKMFNPGSGSLYKTFCGQYNGDDANHAGNYEMVTGGGAYKSTTAVNAIRFLFQSGNITSGTVRVYGIAKTTGSVTAAPFRVVHTFAMVGDVTAITALPSMFVSVYSGQTATLVGLRAKLNSGTSIGVQVKRNGSNVGSVVTVTTTAATTTLSQALADGDELTLTLSSPVGTPTSLGATLILEHTP